MKGLCSGWRRMRLITNRKLRNNMGRMRRQSCDYIPRIMIRSPAFRRFRLSRDKIFGRQNYAWANMTSAQGQKVFVYRFVRKPPTAPGEQELGSFSYGGGSLCL